MEDFSFADLLKEAEKTGFSALPANEYDVTIHNAEAKTTGSGKRKITVTYKVASGPHQGRNVFNDHVISPGNPNALVIFFRQMKSYGLGSDYFAMNPPTEQIAKDLVGRKIRVKLGIRTWNDTERNSVLSIMTSGSGTGSPVMATPMPPAPMPPMPVLPPVPAPPAPVVPEPELVTPPDLEPEPPRPEPKPEPATEREAPRPPQMPF